MVEHLANFICLVFTRFPILILISTFETELSKNFELLNKITEFKIGSSLKQLEVPVCLHPEELKLNAAYTRLFVDKGV